MNILLVLSDNSTSSGAFNSGTILAKELIQKGHNVLVTVPRRGDGEKLLIENKVPYLRVESVNWIVYNQKSFKNQIKKIVKFFKLFYNIIPYYKYKKLIRKNKIQVIHNNTTHTYIAAKAGISEGKKIVWHIREFLEEDQGVRILSKKAGYKLINKSDKIICISSSIYQKYEKVFKGKKLEVIYNGIDEKKYLLSNHNILENDEINLLCVGAVKEKKGQFELCEAIGKLLNKCKYNIKLKLIGGYDDYAEKRIKDICDKYKINNIIELKGKQEDTVKFYSKADIVFMCSTNEAFGRVTVEGMMSGALVVGKDCAATSEIIDNGKTGILYKDSKELVECIEYAIENKEESRKIAKNGQVFAKNLFTAEKNANEIIKIYKQLNDQEET